MSPKIPSRLPIKCVHKDLRQHGVVRSRQDQADQIAEGILPPPHKTGGGSMQATAWWWGIDIEEALERQRTKMAAAGQNEAATHGAADMAMKRSGSSPTRLMTTNRILSSSGRRQPATRKEEDFVAVMAASAGEVI